MKKARARGVTGIATLLASETVMNDGFPDICSLNRGEYKELQDRVHRRYVFKECGVPITHFRSQREFLQGFLDCLLGTYYIKISQRIYLHILSGHYSLLTNANIIHRDISVWNLMFIVDLDNLSDPALRRGLLIDLEYALDRDLLEDAEAAWKLLQEFDDENLDFVHELTYKRIRGVRTVRCICIDNKLRFTFATGYSPIHGLGDIE